MEDESLDLFAGCGIRLNETDSPRALARADQSRRHRFIFVKPADVPVYVEHGIADCGVVGRDVLLESGADVLQPLSLKFGACQIVVASAGNEVKMADGMMRIATKYPRITSQYFAERGQPVEIIQLSGSVELAPVLGLSDGIVDLVETGRTLKANGLRVREVICESSARFVVNRASYQLKAEVIANLIKRMKGESSASS
jgi:ATP phosphoribosyltransferase